MAGHSAFDEDGGGRVAAQPDDAGQRRLQAAIRLQLARGALGAAWALACRTSNPAAGQGGALTVIVETALAMGDGQLARLALAHGEAQGQSTMLEVALMRARIAQAQGDLAAARAILIAAIEAMPDQIAPRRALAEVMVATGTAADARAVLAHLEARHGARRTD